MMKYDVGKIRVYVQPAFLICVLVLAAGGAGMSMTMKRLGVVLEKEPLPLRKSLDLLDEADLGPYRVVPPKLKIENKDVLKALGTDDYIQWVLEDSEEPAGSPVKRCLLFITYYRFADRVPHVPEECWTGGGYQKLPSQHITLEIDDNVSFQAKIPAKYIVFGPKRASHWLDRVRIPNVYFFKVNGQYAGSREQARIALNKNLFGRSSYFCKVELVFNRSAAVPGKEAVIRASEKLLAVILPILEREHWPKWQK